MAVGVLANRTVFGSSFVRLGVVPESENPQLFVSAKRLLSFAITSRPPSEPLYERQLLGHYSPFRKLPIFLVVAKVLPFDIHAVELGERGAAVIQPVGSDGPPDEDP